MPWMLYVLYTVVCTQLPTPNSNVSKWMHHRSRYRGHTCVHTTKMCINNDRGGQQQSYHENIKYTFHSLNAIRLGSFCLDLHLLGLPTLLQSIARSEEKGGQATRIHARDPSRPLGAPWRLRNRARREHGVPRRRHRRSNQDVGDAQG